MATLTSKCVLISGTPLYKGSNISGTQTQCCRSLYACLSQLWYPVSGDAEYSYKISHIEYGAAAADVVVVASTTRDPRNAFNVWLQVAIPSLDRQLRDMGIGLVSTPNRYCVVQFGVREGTDTARFLKVNGNIFFPIEDFIYARRQIHNNPAPSADGYNGIDFAMNHTPFRESSNISKIVLFVSNHERTAVSSHTNRDIASSLQAKDAVFSAVVAANMSIVDPADESVGAEHPHSTRVIGLNMRDEGIATEEGFEFSLVSGRSSIVANHQAQLVREYVNLTLDYGGVVGSLDSLIPPADDTVVESFIGAMVAKSGLHALQQEEVCERCLCGDGDEGEECEAPVCEVDANQELCSCLVQRSPVEVSTVCWEWFPWE